jgi:hypothetical protein
MSNNTIVRKEKLGMRTSKPDTSVKGKELTKKNW